MKFNNSEWALGKLVKKYWSLRVILNNFHLRLSLSCHPFPSSFLAFRESFPNFPIQWVILVFHIFPSCSTEWKISLLPWFLSQKSADIFVLPFWLFQVALLIPLMRLSSALCPLNNFPHAAILLSLLSCNTLWKSSKNLNLTELHLFIFYFFG